MTTDRDLENVAALEEVGKTTLGHTIFREPNGVGGYRYWSDEIGGGVCAWDTCLVSPETLQECLRIELAGANLAHAREAVAQEPVAVPAGALTERIAKLLWERFAPEHHVEWEGETHKAEYRSVADDVLSMLRAYVTVAPTGWRLVPETATDEMIEAAWDSDAADYVGEHKRIHCLADAWKEMLAVAPAAQTADHSEDALDMVRSEKRARALSDLAAADGDLLAAGVDRLPTQPGAS